MKAASRIQTCIELLEKIQGARIPMDNTIRDYMHHRRYIGSKDRAAIVERIYNIVRSHARVSWWLEKESMMDTPRARVIADLSFNGEDLTNLFPGEKHAPPPLDEKEKTFLSQIKGQDLIHPDMPEAAQVECPGWAEEKLRGLFGDDFAAQMNAMLQPAALDLRVNTLKGNVEKAQNLLAAQEVETIKTPYSPVGLRVQGKAFMSATKAFSKGLVEIQDEGSQLIAYMCGAEPGMRVLDYCAGAGGKTLGIAAMMFGKGNITATDIDKRRLEKGRGRYKKAGVHNVELRCLEDEKNRKWLRRQKGTMDVVLVDAPCSSSGTWRRNPDLRWNWYGPSLDEIKELQADILERVADKVKPGGRLVYATCSLFEEENEVQVKKFLENHPEYERAVAPKTAPDLPLNADGALRLTPKDHGTDGFFAAVIFRKES